MQHKEHVFRQTWDLNKNCLIVIRDEISIIVHNLSTTRILTKQLYKEIKCKVIKLFSLSTKVIMLINLKMLTSGCILTFINMIYTSGVYKMQGCGIFKLSTCPWTNKRP